MTIFQWIIPALWLAFAIIWAISALGAKRNVDTAAWWKQGVLLGLAALVLIAFRFAGIGHALRAAQAYQESSVLLGAIGSMLVLTGIGLAIFARVYLGRNWGMPMSRKEEPELITGGPYKLVRHPIYTGVILALLGTAIAENIFGLLPLILFTAYFIYGARREEALMCEQFPGQYPDYMRRTKMILPFVL